VWTLVVVLVDPFNYFGVSPLISEQIKIGNAASLNSLLYNMLKATREPHANLVIGDSRAESLPIDQITNHTFHRLTANALKLNEAIDLFYFAHRRAPLQRVIFTINFNQFNQYAYADRVRSVEDMIHNPLLYLFDRNVAQAGFYVLKAAATDQKSINSNPAMDKREFWDFMVTVRGQEHYGRYRYPESLLQRIKEMVSFAKKNNTDVTFIIVPHHIDFQSRIREFGLMEDYMKFKRDMSRIDARVIDYDYQNVMTTNRSNFNDPIHYNQEFGRLIWNEVQRGPLKLGRLLDAKSPKEDTGFSF